MYKANGEYIKSSILYETFTSNSEPTLTSNVVKLISNTNIQQTDDIGDVVIVGNNKNVNIVSNTPNTIQTLKNISKDELFENKTIIISTLKNLINSKIDKINNMNKDDTYTLFNNLISIL